MENEVRKNISFHFEPSTIERTGNAFTVEKQEGEKKKRYIAGVSSGIKTDKHGERMTQECIADFMRQANSGDILLYLDKHDFKSTEDVGKLVKAEVLQNGDWFTEYKLYDAEDGIGAIKQEKIDNLWKQLAGLPPYSKPKQKGFSIEGMIPDNQIISFEADEKGNVYNRVINKVELEGTVVVPKPAYASVAQAVYKSLGIISPWEKEKVEKNLAGKLSEILDDKKKEGEYFTKKYDIENAFSETIKEIMEDRKPNKQERLSVVFDEYKSLMISLILQSQNIFQPEEKEVAEQMQGVSLTENKAVALKALENGLVKLKEYLKRSNYAKKRNSQNTVKK